MNSSATPSAAPPDAQPIGLIGLGLMGSAIAARLGEKGFSTLGFDLDPARAGLCAAIAGFAPARDGAAVWARCGRIILSLPTHRESQNAIAARGSNAARDKIVIDTSTGEPETAEALARELAADGGAYLDATISGNSDQLRAGEAVFMIGGDAAALELCADLFRALARAHFHAGPPGAGAKMKLATNLVLGLNRAALAEGLAFAEAIGLDAAETLRIMKAGAAHSRIMDAKGEKMLARDYAPQAKLSQHLKDVRLILAAAEKAGLALPLSAAHRALLERSEARGLGELDNSALIETLRERNPRP